MVDLPTEVLEDPVWGRSGHTQKGRDGCRVPIPWTVDGDSAGFGSNGSWLPQPDGWGTMSVEAQDRVEGSTLEFYRDALAARREHMVGDTELTWIDLGADILAYRRGSGVTCMVNMGTEPVEVPDGEIVVRSGEIDGRTLPPDHAVWLR